MNRTWTAGLVLIAGARAGARLANPARLARWARADCVSAGWLLVAFGCPQLRWASATLALIFAALAAGLCTAPVV